MTKAFLMVILSVIGLAAIFPDSVNRTTAAATATFPFVQSDLERPTVTATDPHGNVYVAVYGRCGLYDSIVKLSPSGAVLERLNFTYGSRPGQFKLITGLAADAAGKIYAADLLNNRIQKLSATGAPLASWRGFHAGGHPIAYPQGIGMDAAGNIYVVDSSASRILELSQDGSVLASLSTRYRAQFDISSEVSQPAGLGGIGLFANTFLAGVAIDSTGDVFVATGDDLRKLSPAGLLLAVWRPPSQYAGFRQTPQQVAVDAAGEIFTSGGVAPNRRRGGGYAVFSGTESVDKLSSSGALLAWWHGGRGDPPNLVEPVGLALDKADNLYVADTAYGRIVKLSLDGTILSIWGNSLTSLSRRGRVEVDSGNLVIGPTGNLFVRGSQRKRIEELSPSGRQVASWNSRTHGASPRWPAMATDGHGNLYLVANRNRGIIELDSHGRLVHLWKMSNWQVDDIAVAPWGAIYVLADDNLWMLRLATSRWSLIVRGQSDFSTAQLLWKIAIDPRGRIYAIDQQHISIFSARGKLIGRLTARELCAGISFNPLAIAVGPGGAIFVADSEPTDQILKFSPSGRLLARWGSRGFGPKQFSFIFQAAIAVGRQGNLFVVDGSSHIRKFSPSGRLLATF